MAHGPWLTFPEAYREMKGQVKRAPVLSKASYLPHKKAATQGPRYPATPGAGHAPHLCLSATHAFWTGGLELCFLVLFPVTNCLYVLVPTWICNSNSPSNDMTEVPFLRAPPSSSPSQALWGDPAANPSQELSLGISLCIEPKTNNTLK